MANENILLSIVIPVYKAEKFLDECLNSIVKEKSQQLEIILVDDGSPDNCPKMCDEWAKKDSRVKCIHQENSGPSVARNNGIKLARGKYLAFIDSDDKLYEDSLNKVLLYLSDQKNSFEVCFMNINKFYEDKNILDNNDKIFQKYIKNKSKLSVLNYLSTRQKYPGSACSKIYLRDFIISNNIIFPENRQVEDLYFVLDCILLANCYDSLDFTYYLYRQQEQPTRSNVISTKLVKGIESFIKESVDKLCEGNKPKNKESKCLLSLIAYEFQILMYFYNKAGIKDLEFLKKYKWILKHGKTLKSRVIYLLTKILGLKLSSKIISKIKG